jgi:hypothetical protein
MNQDGTILTLDSLYRQIQGLAAILAAKTGASPIAIVANVASGTEIDPQFLTYKIQMLMLAIASAYGVAVTPYPANKIHGQAIEADQLSKSIAVLLQSITGTFAKSYPAYFNVNLSNPVNMTLSNSTGVVTITNSGGGGVTPSKIGMNLSAAADYESGRVFADAMKSSRPWTTTGGTTLTGSQIDANCWPNQDCAVIVWAGIDKMNGYYALSFLGQATITTGFSSPAIIGQSYNSGTNTTTAVVNYTDTTSTGLQLILTNTKKLAASATNTGVANVKMMRPIAQGSSTSYTVENFTSQFVGTLSNFSALRAMDLTATNSNMIANWADRTTPGMASQAVGNQATSFAVGYQGRGAAWEYVSLLANQTGKDIWVNVPVNATDDYITKMAQLFKYGSDGVNPYTSVQSSPVFPPAPSGVSIYVEYCNELWNGASGFTQGAQNNSLASSEVGLGGSPLNFDGDTNPYNWGWRRIAKRGVDISNIWRSVWGDSAMMTTIRPVMMSQLSYASGPLYQMGILLMGYYANSAYVASPRLPNYFFYGAGGSGYYSASDKSTVDQIFATMGSTFDSQLKSDADYTLTLGLKRIAYEGGPSQDTTGNTSQDAAQLAAWSDARFASVMTTQQVTWDQDAGDLLMYFSQASSQTGYYQWAFMTDVFTPSSPKMTGVANILAVNKSVSTYGASIPATIAGSSAAWPPGYAYGGTNMSNHSWLGFPVKATVAKTYSITVTGTASSSGIAEIIFDGVSLGTVSVPSSGNSAALVTPSLAIGSHGMMIRCSSGTFSFSNITVA